ncbi:MAG: 2-aminoethylphosphonate-pyruvate aminotransferase, partial [Chloroflexota bacterium]
MEHSNYISSANDKPLFTPGPLTTSRTVKQAMLRDLGSRDVAFVNLVK